MMLRKYVESGQSYTKSIDSTCGEGRCVLRR